MQHVGQHDWSRRYHQFNRRKRYNFHDWNGNSNLAFNYCRHDYSEQQHRNRRNSRNHWSNHNAVYTGEQSASFQHADEAHDQHSAKFHQSTDDLYSAPELNGIS
jgi:hypothetical protein